MSIPAETLNGQLVAFDVHTGVYQSQARGKIGRARQSAVVVKVNKQGQVWYLTLTDRYRIEFVHSFADKFLQDFPIELYHYPALRAIRAYARWVRSEGCGISEEARKVINAIIVRR